TSGTTSDTSSGGSTTTATPDPSASASATPSPSASASTASTTVTGSAVDTRYGAVQVEVTFSGNTITAVKTLQSPDRDGRDVEINDQALPILEQEVLASQSANIDTVSGATYTSEGYIQSVQSAIDQR
ncbi:MAG: FMN-binding protein, partial [Leifsonia sp.]|nr:FMN-binding protein [Leifsonia sp.]